MMAFIHSSVVITDRCVLLHRFAILLSSISFSIYNSIIRE